MQWRIRGNLSLDNSDRLVIFWHLPSPFMLDLITLFTNTIICTWKPPNKELLRIALRCIEAIKTEKGNKLIKLGKDCGFLSTSAGFWLFGTFCYFMFFFVIKSRTGGLSGRFASFARRLALSRLSIWPWSYRRESWFMAEQLLPRLFVKYLSIKRLHPRNFFHEGW